MMLLKHSPQRGDHVLVIHTLQRQLSQQVREQHGMPRIFLEQTRQSGHEIFAHRMHAHPVPPAQQERRQRIEVDGHHMGIPLQEGAGQTPSAAGPDQNQTFHGGIPSFEPLGYGAFEVRVPVATEECAQVPAQSSRLSDEARARGRDTGSPERRLIYIPTVNRTHPENLRMKSQAWRLLSLLTLCLAGPAFGADSPPAKCAVASDADVVALFDKWNLTLTTLDSAKVANLYWPDAVLLPTVSNKPRTDTALIKDYFDHFLEKHPRGRIDERHVHHGCNMSVDMGLYTFFLLDGSGKPQEVNARYTYVYTFRDGMWKIQHHHSSAMPEPVGAPAAAPAAEHKAAAHDAPKPTAATPAKAADVEVATKPAAESRVLRARLQRMPPLKHISEFVAKESMETIGNDTVSVKVCATGEDAAQRSFEVSDASPQAAANEAALAWARASSWALQNPNAEAFPVCTHVVARFGS